MNENKDKLISDSVIGLKSLGQKNFLHWSSRYLVNFKIVKSLEVKRFEDTNVESREWETDG